MTAVITGAGRGIGKAIALRLARDGHLVVALDLDSDAARRTAEETGGIAHRCDVTDVADLEAVAAHVDRCDVLVNNAGIWRYGALLDMTPTDVLDVLAVNVVGLVNACQTFVPKMVDHGGGTIVNVSSAATWTNTPGTGLYPASKAAVDSLTRQMAIEWGSLGVRVNAVAPGLVATEGTQDHDQGDRQDARGRHSPLGRVGHPDDIADVVAFLSSQDARYITGQVLFADGGVSAGLGPRRPRPSTANVIDAATLPSGRSGEGADIRGSR